MGNRTSSPQQQAEHRGQQISASNWLQRLKATQIRQSANQPVTRADLQKVQGQLRHDIDKVRSDRVTAGQIAGKGAKMLARGFKDIGTSLSTPYAPGHRPRISQLPPPQRSPMRRGFNLSNLQDPSLRGRDITGRRINKGGQ